MVLIKKASDLNKFLSHVKTNSSSIGFVPTMGALHAGHLSLIAASKSANDFTISSIFVNPTQFNDPKDFQKYPVTLESDINALVHAGCDLLFLPSVEEMYPDGTESKKTFDLGYLETILEGKFRPGHFQGVSQVMERLIDLTQPDDIYMGQKDYQQCMVVNRLLQILHSPSDLHPCETLREKDGLAMSSRNLRLKEDERAKATAIYKTLLYLKENLKPGSVEGLIEEATRQLELAGLKPDYVALADAETLRLVSEWDGVRKLSALIAAFVNEVRLIDNMIISN